MKNSPLPILIRRTPGADNSFMLFYAEGSANCGCVGSREVRILSDGTADIWAYGEASIDYYRECPKATPEEQKRVLDAIARFEECNVRLLQRLSYKRLRKIWAWRFE